MHTADISPVAPRFPSITLDERAAMAATSLEESDKLISEFGPYIKSCVQRYAFSAPPFRRDEMNGVAMLAFYEAIRSYDSAKGHFLPLAARVIRQRLIDDLRAEYRAKGAVIPLEIPDDEADGGPYALMSASLERYEEQQEQSRLRMEIEQLTAELANIGISFDTLIRESPKHTALRGELRRALTAAASSAEVVETVLIKRYLPIKKISLISKVPEKKIERARSYLMACLMILTNDYPCLSAYLRLGKEDGS